MQKVVLRSINVVNGALEKLSIALMLFLLFLTFANVIGRYVFANSIFFADEMARFIFVWVVFLGIAKVVKDKRQVCVALLTEKLKGSMSGFVVESFIFVVGTVFLIVVFSGGVRLSGTMNFYSSAAMGVPMGYVYLAVPIGSGLTLVFHILNYVELVLEYFGRESEGN